MSNKRINAAAVLTACDEKKSFCRRQPDGRWETIEIGDVWTEYVRGSNTIHAVTEGEELTFPIGPEQQKKWQTAKQNLVRLSILARASSGELRLRKETRPRIIGIRVSEDEYRRLEDEAESCNISISKYCQQQLAGCRPNAIPAEVCEAMIVIRRHLTNYASALKSVYAKVPESQRTSWIVEGMNWRQYREYMVEILKYFDSQLKK